MSLTRHVAYSVTGKSPFTLAPSQRQLLLADTLKPLYKLDHSATQSQDVSYATDPTYGFAGMITKV
jgi:hypothetical protein